MPIPTKKSGEGDRYSDMGSGYVPTLQAFGNVAIILGKFSSSSPRQTPAYGQAPPGIHIIDEFRDLSIQPNLSDSPCTGPYGTVVPHPHFATASDCMTRAAVSACNPTFTSPRGQYWPSARGLLGTKRRAPRPIDGWRPPFQWRAKNFVLDLTII